MTNNSDGLSPSLRAQLGVGWNRALPSAFGFENGIQGDNVNDYLEILPLYGKNVPGNLTFEFWIIPTGATREGLFAMSYNGDSNSAFGFSLEANQTALQQYNTGQPLSGCTVSLITGVKNHIIFSYDLVNKKLSSWCNGINYTASSSTPNPLPFPLTFAAVRLLYAVAGGINSSYARSRFKIDEFRIYNSLFTTSLATLNYNAGIGNNPAETENLFVWYKFEQFENLDFSPLQDNSDIRPGIRDFSGKNNHAIPVNMDTNPASSTYVLKPF